MANKNLKRFLIDFPLAHLPTLALIIGTFSFWLELYIIRLPSGHSSWMAWGIFIFCSLAIGISQRLSLRNILIKDLSKIFIVIPVVLGSIYLAIGLYASFLPPHLVQESDALTYHITLPRQHLIGHSFTHLPWSVPDLFLLPLDYALSPFELSTIWPNKMIQFIFLLGSLGCVFHLVYLLSGKSLQRAWIGVLAVMACHAVAIQVGLAMLDLVMLYCFLAFIHSLILENWVLAAIEFTFFFWSKSFIPPQMVVIGIILGIIIFWGMKNSFSVDEIPIPGWRKLKIWMTAFGTASLVIALPHLLKSFYYSGTPFYPFGIGIMDPLVKYPPDYWHAMVQRAGDCLDVKDNYGHGRSILAFLKHFWLIAVPEGGVNNTFDYPVGLMYLLVLTPFLGHVFNSIKSRKLPVLSMIIVIWWMTWWFGSQQSRFLLIPICLMIILTISQLPKLSAVLVILIMLVLGLEDISLINAHRHDWGKTFREVLRDKDIKLLDLNPPAGTETILSFPDAAFASYPVTVRGSDSIFVLPQ